ncbi:SdpI family protein [Clostridiisalibacter paucivorans]|uniref:SdpI family protein n=1 Tax=Clostridiisalibacter paucivorans TaxID=408753 RepID=UPI000685B07A|nr:SdpI family protein [Clostridiisalibacter paucivorans]
MKEIKINKKLLILIIVSIIMTIAIYNKLPHRVPSHWNFKGEIDDYQNKAFVFFSATLPLIIYLLMYIVPNIDPKRESYKKHKKAYMATIYVVTLFLITLHWLSILVALGYSIDISLVVRIGIGIMFIVLGNYMGQIRHNYLFGIKNPWTLANEKVWRKTHRFGGYLFMIVGLLFVISILINNSLNFIIPIISLFFMLIIVNVYSYLLYKELKK